VNTRPERSAWLAAAAGAVFTLWVFWPGWMSVDSGVQYAQAIGLRRLDDVHPPLMTLLWRVADRVLQGSGALFALLVAAWWSAIAAWCAPLPLSRSAKIGVVLALGLWPATFLMLGHVWKDVAMASSLLLAAAAIRAHRRAARQADPKAPAARWRWLALLALAVACCLRHNAIFAALPLLVWLTGRRAVLLPAALVLALLPGAVATLAQAQRTQAWTVVALWDLAALSVQADRVLLPPSLIVPTLTVDELRRVYVPYANPPLFDLGKIRISLYVPYSQSQTRDLVQSWWRAVRDDPAAYLRHRARLARYLLLGFPAGVPRELVFVPQRFVLPGTPWAPPPVDADAAVVRAADALRTTPLFAGATYLLLAAFAVALRRRADVVALAASAWANALPLLVISGSAEFRYLAWTALAALAALAAALAGRRADFG